MRQDRCAGPGSVPTSTRDPSVVQRPAGQRPRSARIGPRCSESSPPPIVSTCSVAFVKWHGLRVLEEHIEAFIRRGGRLRVITTTYIGATERRAARPARRTRRRGQGLLRDADDPAARQGVAVPPRHRLLDRVRRLVEPVEEPRCSTGWSGTSACRPSSKATCSTRSGRPSTSTGRTRFEPYDPDDPAHRARLDEALAAERGGTDRPAHRAHDARGAAVGLPAGDPRRAGGRARDPRPPRNLVVMATGTGKTVVAGLDYRRLREAGAVDSLLFVAHREEILGQSLSTFRHIMRDGSFGERFVGGERPTEWRHVFASVQSLARLDLDRDLRPTGSTWSSSTSSTTPARRPRPTRDSCATSQPKVLLGLTATPSGPTASTSGVWFDGRIAVELRLWEALERGLLAPFQYFGVHDETDLPSRPLEARHGLRPRRADQRLHRPRRADSDRPAGAAGQGHRRRADAGARVLRQHRPRRVHGRPVQRRRHPVAGGDVADAADGSRVLARGASKPRRQRPLHRRPVQRGRRRARDRHGAVPPPDRERDRVPPAARPRPSPRRRQAVSHGARLHRQPSRRVPLRPALPRRSPGVSRRGLAREIEHGFPTLPAGLPHRARPVSRPSSCSRTSCRRSASTGRVSSRSFVSSATCTLGDFLDETGLELDDIYRRRRGGWAGSDAWRSSTTGRRGPTTTQLAARSVACSTSTTSNGSIPRRLLGRDQRLRCSRVRRTRGAAARHAALLPLGLERAARRRSTRSSSGSGPTRATRGAPRTAACRCATHPADHAPSTPRAIVPLHVHARYSLAELLAAFGVPNPAASRGSGVKWIEDDAGRRVLVQPPQDREALLADHDVRRPCDQPDRCSSGSRRTRPPTLADRAALRPPSRAWLICPPLLPRVQGSRRRPRRARRTSTPARRTYVSHTGDRPMRIIWKLDHELPADVFHAARVESAQPTAPSGADLEG